MRSLETFFALNPVFTFDEAKDYLSAHAKMRSSVPKLLHYHHKMGRILLIRRGLYYVVPAGTLAATCPVDGQLVASKMVADAVLGYHTALDVHGVSHTVWSSFYFPTKTRAKGPFTFRGCTYQAVSIPTALVKTVQADFGVMTIERMGVKMKVTTLERTLVDVLDRPQLGGGWEEIWKSFEGVEYLDLEQIIEYALLLSNRLVIAKVGYFLDTHREQFRVTEKHLEKLHRFPMSQARYVERVSKGPQKLIPSWNLIIPQALHERSWEEPHGDF
jgi:predicted transcriptional regulator of viral defense system